MEGAHTRTQKKICVRVCVDSERETEVVVVCMHTEKTCKHTQATEREGSIVVVYTQIHTDVRIPDR